MALRLHDEQQPPKRHHGLTRAGVMGHGELGVDLTADSELEASRERTGKEERSQGERERGQNGAKKRREIGRGRYTDAHTHTHKMDKPHILILCRTLLITLGQFRAPAAVRRRPRPSWPAGSAAREIRSSCDRAREPGHFARLKVETAHASSQAASVRRQRPAACRPL